MWLMVVVVSSSDSKISPFLLPDLIRLVEKMKKRGKNVVEELILFILTLDFVGSLDLLLLTEFCTSSFWVNTISSVTSIHRCNDAEQGRTYDQSLKLWMSHHLHGHRITIWALGNQFAVTMVAVAPRHVIAFTTYPADFP